MVRDDEKLQGVYGFPGFQAPEMLEGGEYGETIAPQQ